MEQQKDSTLGKYCFLWGEVEAKSPAMFKDASICSKECAKFSEKYGTCRDELLKDIQIEEGLH